MKIVTTNASEQITQTEPIVLVDFFATWCGPCKMLAPELEKLAEKLKGKLTILKVDVDESSDLAMKFGIMSVPTMILFKDGKVAKQFMGYQPLAQLEANIAPWLSEAI